MTHIDIFGGTMESQALEKERLRALMPQRSFSLGPEDSAIIFRADGSEEVRTPNGKDNDPVCLSAYKCLQAVMALHDPDTIREIDKQIQLRKPA